MKTNMLSTQQKSSFIFPLFCFAITLPVITSLPVPSRDDPFAKFVEFLTQNNCSMPSVVDIPFPKTDSSPFSYLTTPLKECQSPEALKENNEANLLCREAFDVLQNITCNDYSSLPKINSSRLSENICNDFAAIQEILPKQKEYLSGKLGDKVICKVLCTEKYELLCKTLLWSYDTQAKIKNILDSKTKVNQEGNVNNIVPNETPILQPHTPDDAKEDGGEKNPKANEISDKTNAFPNVSSLSNFGNESLLKSTPLDDISNNKSSSSVSSSKDKLTNSSQTVSTKINVQVDSQKSPLEDDIQPTEQNPELPDDKNIDEKENAIKMQPESKVENPSTKVNSFTTKDISNQSRGSNTSTVVGSDAKSTPVVKPPVSESAMTHVGLQEPQEDDKLTDLKKQGNSKENLVSDGVTLETDLNLPSTVLSELERPEGKDPELYNDSENDGDYPKQEYDNGFSSLKKESDIKNSVVEDGSSRMSSSSSIQLNPDSFGGQFDGSQSFLPARKYLPEQEDSHFFFYFLSIVLILMAGYLIFHNKQKIIALIVEGRHERSRRRSHGAGYKKLETK